MYNEVDTPSLYEAQNEIVPQEEHKIEAPQESARPQNDEKANNLRLLRERAERAEQRAQELERFLRSQPQQVPQAQAQQHDDDDDDIAIADDSYAEGKDLKKIYRKTSKEFQEIKRMLQERDQQTALQTAEIRLKAEYPDITEIVTQENLKDLDYIRPDLYETIMYNPDVYKRGKIAREMIQNYVLNQKYTEQEKRINDNRGRPRSAASVSPQQGTETPLTRLNDYDRRILTEERKEQLRRQVAEAKRFR